MKMNLKEAIEKTVKSVTAAVALVAALFIAGCGGDEEGAKGEAAAVLPSAPESYMNDTEFRVKVASQGKLKKSLQAEGIKCRDRMQELVKEHGGDQAKLEKLPEWNELKKRIAEIEAEYAKIHKEQRATMSSRMGGQKKQ
jgi:hypothetical protein